MKTDCEEALNKQQHFQKHSLTVAFGSFSNNLALSKAVFKSLNLLSGVEAPLIAETNRLSLGAS